MHGWDADVAEESPSADVYNAGVCNLGAEFFNVRSFVDEDGTLLDNVNLPTNKAMLALECVPKCVHDARHMGSALIDVEFTIKLSRHDEWVGDVKTIVNAELGELRTRLNSRYGEGKVIRCMPPGYFLATFWVKIEETTLYKCWRRRGCMRPMVIPAVCDDTR